MNELEIKCLQLCFVDQMAECEPSNMILKVIQIAYCTYDGVWRLIFHHRHTGCVVQTKPIAMLGTPYSLVNPALYKWSNNKWHRLRFKKWFINNINWRIKEIRQHEQACQTQFLTRLSGKVIALFNFEGFTSIPTALTANDRNRRIQVYQASDG